MVANGGALDASPADVAIADLDCGTQRESPESGQRAVRALGQVVPVIVLADQLSLPAAEFGTRCAAAIVPKPFDLKILLETETAPVASACRHCGMARGRGFLLDGRPLAGAFRSRWRGPTEWTYSAMQRAATFCAEHSRVISAERYTGLETEVARVDEVARLQPRAASPAERRVQPSGPNYVNWLSLLSEAS